MDQSGKANEDKKYSQGVIDYLFFRAEGIVFNWFKLWWTQVENARRVSEEHNWLGMELSNLSARWKWWSRGVTARAAPHPQPFLPKVNSASSQRRQWQQVKGGGKKRGGGGGKGPATQLHDLNSNQTSFKACFISASGEIVPPDSSPWQPVSHFRSVMPHYHLAGSHTPAWQVLSAPCDNHSRLMLFIFGVRLALADWKATSTPWTTSTTPHLAIRDDLRRYLLTCV